MEKSVFFTLSGIFESGKEYEAFQEDFLDPRFCWMSDD